MGTGKSLVNKNFIHTLTSIIGKENYMAPEVRNQTDKIDWFKADVLSFGKLILEVALLSKITNDQKSIQTAQQGMKNENVYSSKLVNCIEKCLCYTFTERYTWKKLNSVFIQSKTTTIW